MRTRHRSRPLLAATMGLLALVIAAPPVAAGEVKNSGKTGSYQIVDEENDADAICRYRSNGAIDRITIEYPYVHSSDYLPDTQKQWVGWAVVIDRKSPSGSTWSRWYRSSFVKDQATNLLIADFADRTFDLGSGNWHWRARTIIRYYKPGTSTQTIGTVIYKYDWYKRRKAQSSATSYGMGYCIPEY